MKKRILWGFILTVVVMGSVSCSKSVLPDPDGTVTLNMYNEENGKTLLGNSIYINQSNNFCTKQNGVGFKEVGKVGGLGDVVDLNFKGAASEVAMKVGCGYLIGISDNTHFFPSGRLAYRAEYFYYTLFVESDLKKDDKSVGAVVKYAHLQAMQNGLPKEGTECRFDYFYKAGQGSEWHDCAVIELPKNHEYECYLPDYAEAFDIQIGEFKNITDRNDRAVNGYGITILLKNNKEIDRFNAMLIRADNVWSHVSLVRPY